MSTTLTLDGFVRWLESFRARIDEQTAYLTELDSAIGDADHGSNMARGMAAVMTKVG